MPGLYGNGAGNVTVPAGSTSGLYQLSQDINVVQATNYGNANVADFLASGNLTSNVITTGNISGSYILGNGSQLTGLPATYGNANVATFLPTYTGNLAGGNIAVANNATVGGNLTVAGTIYGTFSGNITGNLVVPGSNTQVIYNNSGNAGASSDFTYNDSTKLLDVNGNVSANYFIGDGSQLTGLPASYGNANVAAYLPTYTGNLNPGNLSVGTSATFNNHVLANVADPVSAQDAATKNYVDGQLSSTGFDITDGVTTESVGLGDTITFAGVANETTVSVSAPDTVTIGLPDNVTIAGNVSPNAIKTDNYQYANGTPVSFAGTYGNSNVSAYLASGTNTANIITTGNISGQYILGNGSQLTGLPATYGNSNVTTLLASFGSNTITTTGNITAGYFSGDGSLLTNINAGNISGSYGNANVANFLANYGSNTITTTGNITGGNIAATNTASANIVDVTTQVNTPKVYSSSDLSIVANGANINMTPISMPIQNINMVTPNVNVTGKVSVSGNVTGSNIIGNGQYLTNLPGANVTGTVPLATSATTAGTVTTAAQPNITSVGTLTSLNVSGNAIVGGNLTVNGNTIYTNITELNVQDPIISQGRGPNNTPLVSNDGKDRGEQFWYFTTTEKSAFSGYDNSTGKMLLATDVSIANEIVTVNALGNIVGGNIEATSVTTSGNVTASYVVGNGSQLSSLTGANVTGTVPLATAATTAGTVTTAAQPNITSVGTLSSLAVTGNITGGNVIATHYGSGAGLSSLTGANVTGTVANATYAVSAGSATTAVTATSATTAGTVTTAAQPNITSVGTLTSLSVSGNIVATGNITGNTLITSGTGGDITGVNHAYANYVIANTSITSNGPITAGAVTYANTDGTAGQVLTTYGNGITYWNTAATSTYGNSNVNTLLASWGSNTLSTTGNVTAGYFIGNGSTLTNLTGANVTGTVANATYATSAGSATTATTATSATTAGTVTTAAQPNITSVGTLSSLAVTGNVTGGNLIASGILRSTQSQPNEGGEIQLSIPSSGTTLTGNVIIDSYQDKIRFFINDGTTNKGAYIDLTAAGNSVGSNLLAGSGSTYGDSNVNTLLASWGSNTLSTTGNVTAGNMILSGQIYDTSGVLQLNGSGNVVLVPVGSTQIYGNTNIIGGKLTIDAVTYTNVDGTAGQVLTTYGNGKTYFSTVSGGSYGDSNVNTLLSSWGSNTLSTTGNVTAGNLIATGNVKLGSTGNGLIYVDSGDYTIVGSGNVSAGGVMISGDGTMLMGTLGGIGPVMITGYGTTYRSVGWDSGANLNFNILGSGAGNITNVNNYSGLGAITNTGNITGGNLIANGTVKSGAVTITGTDGTNGQVLTTYGNGVTYFSTVSGGGGTPGGNTAEIQFNNAGSFAGNAAMTFDNTTGNISFGNLVIGNTGTSGTYYNVLTNKNPYLGNTTTMPSNARVLIGSGKNGDWSTSTDYNANSRNARVLIADEYVKTDNGIRNSELAVTSYANLNGATTFASANNNSRIQGIVSDVYVMNGNITATGSGAAITRGMAGAVTMGTGANANMSNVSHATGMSGTVVVNGGSSVGNAFGMISFTSGAGPINTQIGYGIQIQGNANGSGNVYGVYNPGGTSTVGVSNGSAARNSPNYYFLRNDDGLAKNNIGQMNRYYDGLANTGGSSGGSLTINASNGQFQYLNVTEDVTSISFSNFVNFVSTPSGNISTTADTVTLAIIQDATGRTITMPSSSGSNIYKYAGGISTVGTTANSITMVSITGVLDNSGNNLYLITISPEFS